MQLGANSVETSCSVKSCCPKIWGEIGKIAENPFSPSGRVKFGWLDSDDSQYVLIMFTFLFRNLHHYCIIFQLLTLVLISSNDESNATYPQNLIFVLFFIKS